MTVAKRPDLARRVLVRAATACPWAKTLWVDGMPVGDFVVGTCGFLNAASAGGMQHAE